MNVVLRPRVEPDGLPWLLHLVASGQAGSRSDLSRLAALAPSTTSLKVEALQRAGYLSESGKGESRGGRRPRRLTLHEHAGVVVGVDLGRRHARLAAVDLAGLVVRTADLELDLAEGPPAVLPVIAQAVQHLAGETGQRLLAAGIGLPGPVAYPAGITVMPSRMPGWHGYEVRDALERSLGVAVLVDNDANLMALGEVRGATDAARSMVVAKLGGGIGCGVVSDGALVRGVSGAAGDISHVRVAGARDAPCECGRTGCLEAVASGAVLVREAQAGGADIRHTLGLIEATEAGDDRLRRTLRTAGTHIGEVLAAVVDFVNPAELVLGGALSRSPELVASIRTVVYDHALPLATRDLSVLVTRIGRDATTLGAASLALDEVFATLKEA